MEDATKKLWVAGGKTSTVIVSLPTMQKSRFLHPKQAEHQIPTNTIENILRTSLGILEGGHRGVSHSQLLSQLLRSGFF